MNAETIREYCLKKIEVTEGFPFNETVLVFKVNGKMFLLLDLEAELRFSVKCEPDKAIRLRELYPAVTPGYHLDKQKWNTIYVDGSIPEEEMLEWIDDSYRLVIETMAKKHRIRLLGDG